MKQAYSAAPCSKYFVLIIICSLTVSLLYSVNSQVTRAQVSSCDSTAPGSSFQTCENSNYKFSIQYPSTWIDGGNGLFYEISFIAEVEKFDQLLPLAEKLIDSFLITNPANEIVPSTPVGASDISQSSTEGLLTFEHPSLGFSVQYPSNWTATEKVVPPGAPVDIGTSIGVRITSPEPARISPMPMPLVPQIDVDDLSHFNIDSLQSAVDSIDFIFERPENHLISYLPSNRSNLNEAVEVKYTLTGEDPVLKVLDIFTRSSDGSIYEINYIADLDEFDQFLPVANQIINSFQANTSANSVSPG